jgi:secreted trypsin-like serine protease
MRRTRSRLLAIAVTAIAAATASVAVAQDASAVANGETVAEGHYRFSVKLVMTGIPTATGGKRNSGCSGALISRQWIITAGHCFRDANGVRVEHPVADLTSATLGKADLTNGGGVVRTVVAVRQSPDRDIAVAQLDKPVWGIEPLRLATKAPAVGDTLRLTGWGADNSANPVQSVVLRTGKFTVSSVSPTIVGVKGLAPQPDTSACPYDSGAPYFIGQRLVAVESGGPSCPHALEETTARVDTAAAWIRAAIH